jgi:hypothetical protein
MNQDHHRDPTLILLLAPGTPTWSSLQGSHAGVANMAPFAISSSLILVIHDNMINATNHIV